jgi:hypothetical protein
MEQSWKCFYTNASSIVNKFDEIRWRVSTANYDLIAITETWLKPDISDAEIWIGTANWMVAPLKNRGYS